MYTLYTFATPHGRRASIMLEELGQPYVVKALDLTKGEQTAPDFLKISPLGKIPALEDDDGDHVRRVFGSQAVLMYLAERHDQLMPLAPADRVEAMNWLGVAATDLGPNGLNIYFFTQRKPLPEAVDRFIGENGRVFRAMNERLGDVQYLAGSHYSIADIAAYPFIERAAASAPEVIAAHPQLQRWFDEIGARPAVQRGMAVPEQRRQNRQDLSPRGV